MVRTGPTRRLATTIVAIGAALALATGLGASGVARADDYPSRPITFIVGAPPGGTIDLVARVLADSLGRKLGHTVVVENKAGGAGNIAAVYVARNTPDGYTLLVTAANNLAVSAYITHHLPYDMEHDFAPIAKLASVPAILVANHKNGFHDVADLIRMARAKPGQLLYGEQGVGGSGQLGMRLLTLTAGIKMVDVTYQGSTNAMRGLLGGEIDVMFDNPPTVLPQLEQGNIVALGVASRTRIKQAPDIQPVAEQGLPGFEAGTWIGIVAPAATPQPIIAQLNAAINEAMKSPDAIKRADFLGLQLSESTPQSFSEFIAAERTKWKKIVDLSGLHID